MRAARPPGVQEALGALDLQIDRARIEAAVPAASATRPPRWRT
jgi:hypothetical protein